MKYFETSEINRLIMEIKAYLELNIDCGKKDVLEVLYQKLINNLNVCLHEFEQLSSERGDLNNEPDELDSIQKQAPHFDTSMHYFVDTVSIRDKISGAVMGRFIGCLLGIPVEGWKMRDIEGFARQLGTEYPPCDYWIDIYWPEWVADGKDQRKKYSKSELTCVRADDDITYTLLNLLIMERYGFNVTTDNIGCFWKKNLPKAHTAEKVALSNLLSGYRGRDAATHRNPYTNWIGASIRSDIWAWVYPGQPGKAAELAWRDGMLTHRSSGLYGEMFYAAMQAVAFALTDVNEIISVGLQFIPQDSHLSIDIKWAIERMKSIDDWREISDALQERFKNQSHVHMNCNACLVVMSLLYGDGDFDVTLGIITALGYDTDCNAASAGSILGAICGEERIAQKWKTPFSGPILSYISGYERFHFQDVVNRIYALSEEGKGSRKTLLFRHFWESILNDHILKKSIEQTIQNQEIILENKDVIELLPMSDKSATVILTDRTSLEAAASYREKAKQIALLNFASGTTPGGGTRINDHGQEEGLCHCTTLYPCLNSDKPVQLFYSPHKEGDTVFQTDDIIYSPGISVVRINPAEELYSLKEIFKINVISCAAPNLRTIRGNLDLSRERSVVDCIGVSKADYRYILQKRFERIMLVGASFKNQILILGAFGCGAYRNDPQEVALALKQAIAKYKYSYEMIEIAIPRNNTRRGIDNYEVFKKILECSL